MVKEYKLKVNKYEVKLTGGKYDWPQPIRHEGNKATFTGD